mgnify:CR=1 FL=1
MAEHIGAQAQETIFYFELRGLFSQAIRTRVKLILLLNMLAMDVYLVNYV